MRKPRSFGSDRPLATVEISGVPHSMFGLLNRSGLWGSVEEWQQSYRLV